MWIESWSKEACTYNHCTIASSPPDSIGWVCIASLACFPAKWASSLQSFTWLWIHCIFLHSDISQATSKLYWQKELGPSCWMQHRVQSYILNWIRGMLVPLIDELLSLSLVCFFMLKPHEDLVFTGCNGLWSFPSKETQNTKKWMSHWNRVKYTWAKMMVENQRSLPSSPAAIISISSTVTNPPSKTSFCVCNYHFVPI